MAKQNNLQLPKQANPKLKAWAEQLKRQYPKPKQFVNQVLLHIHSLPFWYRLKPKAIGQDHHQLDKFWFDTREGYCEHYSSAVTFILRAAKIPARVVVGYFGGEWNPVGNYLNVRQKDAHAWLEYYDPNVGWKRLDPTRFIAQNRIEKTILSQDERAYALLNEWENLKKSMPMFSSMYWQLQSTRFFLERWLLFYNQDRQQTLMELLNLGPWSVIKLLQFWVIAAFIFLLLTGLWYLRTRTIKNPIIREHKKLKQALSRHHIDTEAPNTLSQQLQALAKSHPECKSWIEPFIQRYETIRLKRCQISDSEAISATVYLLKTLRKRIALVNRYRWLQKP